MPITAASQERPCRHNKMVVRKVTPFLAIMRSSYLML